MVDGDLGGNGAAKRVTNDDGMGYFFDFYQIKYKLTVVGEGECLAGGIGKVGGIEIKIVFEELKERVE